jgi:hypothetical protein
LKLFYARENYDFRAELFDILQVWITLMLKHFKKASIERDKQAA